MLKQSKGLVIVYTGNGKGKTTAALGLVIRASGYKNKVLIIQFIKNTFSGEIKSLKLFKSVKVIQGGKGFVGILGDKLSLEEHKKAAQEALEKLSREILSGKWDLVIADEILGAVAGKLLNVSQAIELIKSKPVNLNLVLTGRNAPKEIIKMADLVTEMKEIKHPFRKGMLAKEGIDY